MSKTGYTKNRILDIIKNRQKMTLSDISKELELNPSTVSQHIQELKDIGAIEETRNAYIKKWKYYRITPGFEQANLSSGSETKNLNTKAILCVGAVILLTLIGIVYFIGRPIGTVGQGNLVRIALTDPPTVPEGTQALFINYSSISVQTIENGSSIWIQSNTSGSIDLLTLINYSQIITGIRIPKNSEIKSIRFNINSADIIINNSEYSLILRNGQINTSVIGGDSVENNSEILVDLSPIVTPMYINGVTVLVMVPQAGSVTLNQNSTGSSNRSKLTGDELKVLDDDINSSFSITNPILVASNGSINFSVTIKNYGNRTIDLKNILILGEQDLINSSGSYVPLTYIPVSGRHMALEFTVQQNDTISFANNKSLSPSLERINGTYPYSPLGDILVQNQSITLTYNGNLYVSNGSRLSLIKGMDYKISVLGDYIPHLTVNTTAT